MASVLSVMKRFVKGIVLRGESADVSENVEGSLFHNKSDARIKTYIQSSVREIITNSQSQVLTNKTIDYSQNTILNIPGLDSSFDIFNTTITIGTSASTATGLLHFKATQNITLTSIKAQLFEKNGVSSGILEVDVKKNSTPDDVGMTSICSIKPSFDFASISDYAISNGTISTTSISSGEYLRLDLTNIPTGFVGHVQLTLTGVI